MTDTGGDKFSDGYDGQPDVDDDGDTLGGVPLAEVLADLAEQMELFTAGDATRGQEVAQLKERVDALQDTVKGVAKKLTDKQASGVRRWRSWSELTPADQVKIAGQLVAWVDWLIATYRIPSTAVPSCWWMHPGLRHELTALWWSHQAAYDPTAAEDGPTHWHEMLARALGRWPTLHTGCKERHLSPRIAVHTTSEDFTTADWR